MRRSPVLALTLALVCAMAISGTSVLAQAQTPVAQTGCGTGLKSFGPLNESGYPAHYVTQEDFILDHCDETTDDDPLCGNAPFGDPTGEGLPNGPVPDVATRVSGVQAGDYDYAEFVPGDLYEDLSADQSVKIHVNGAPIFGMMFVNSKEGLLKDNFKLRRAVQMALNKEEALRVSIGP